MAGEHIALVRILRLKGALRSLIASQEFQNMNQFEEEVQVLQSEDFWKFLFTMCRSLYAPMRLLRLADQKIPAMDKLHFYVCQTDSYLSKYLKEAMIDARLVKDQRLLDIMDMVLFKVVEADASDDENEDDDDNEGYGDAGEDFDDEDDEMSKNENSDDDDDDATEDQNFTSDAIMAGKGQLRQVVSSHIYSFIETCSCKRVPSINFLL